MVSRPLGGGGGGAFLHVERGGASAYDAEQSPRPLGQTAIVALIEPGKGKEFEPASLRDQFRRHAILGQGVLNSCG